MNRLLGAGLAAQQFAGAIADHFVEIHVGLRAGAGLPHHQREVVVELAVDDFASGTNDGAGAALVEQAKLEIALGGRKLHDCKRADDRHRHAFAADFEVVL